MCYFSFQARKSTISPGMNLFVRPRAPNHPNNDALDTLRPCVEHNFSWNNKNMIKRNFTSRFTGQPSSGEGITLEELKLRFYWESKKLTIIIWVSS